MIDHKTIMNGVISMFGSTLDDDCKSHILCESTRLHNKHYKPEKLSSETTYYATIVMSIITREFDNIKKIINRNKKIDEILSKNNFGKEILNKLNEY